MLSKNCGRCNVKKKLAMKTWKNSHQKWVIFCLKYKNHNYSNERRAQLKLHTTCRGNCLLRIWVLLRITALVEHSKTQVTECTSMQIDKILTQNDNAPILVMDSAMGLFPSRNGVFICAFRQSGNVFTQK